jgi:hypothetical protein
MVGEEPLEVEGGADRWVRGVSDWKRGREMGCPWAELGRWTILTAE